MKIKGQIFLISISVLFTLYQVVFFDDPLDKELLDFTIATLIAWFVGWQYDKAMFYGKERKASEESYRQLINSLPEAVLIHHGNKILFANAAAIELFGAQKHEELVGKDVYDLLFADYRERAKERIKQVYKEKKPLVNIEHKVSKLDGSTIFCEVSSLYIVYEGKEAVLTIGKDITERKAETERLLQKSEKLALLGQMAAGIAHEIRNPLTSIKGFIQLFRTNSDQQEYYDLVLSELERINNIVGEFLVLAKPSSVVFKEHQVESLVKDVITLINSQSLLNNVQIEIEVSNDLPAISCEETQMKQVFLNILKNSIEAMPAGGIIRVTVSKLNRDKLSVKFIDNGAGIPEERMASLGEPFYTTKEKGTGLGLMISFKIVESHNGELKISSERNIGTTVEVILPTITQTYLKPVLDFPEAN
ncbi:ATP-binding protein [Mesobacillus harenae]|uniref:ATP-binding protein n=1 Tax=Mesobacillus harenae TaxID=2213203 RepID=UPI00158060BD|nr:ATP-binding protein [Mesobacillus harenae]